MLFCSGLYPPYPYDAEIVDVALPGPAPLLLGNFSQEGPGGHNFSVPFQLLERVFPHGFSLEVLVFLFSDPSCSLCLTCSLAPQEGGGMFALATFRYGDNPYGPFKGKPPVHLSKRVTEDPWPAGMSLASTVVSLDAVRAGHTVPVTKVSEGISREPEMLGSARRSMHADAPVKRLEATQITHCLSYDAQKGRWDSFGCVPLFRNNGRFARCKCDHTAEYAVAVEIPSPLPVCPPGRTSADSDCNVTDTRTIAFIGFVGSRFIRAPSAAAVDPNSRAYITMFFPTS